MKYFRKFEKYRKVDSKKELYVVPLPKVKHC